ncbi:MAG: hypothetical protein ONA90_04420 [candidate division KSB1 bacterium]|nr:hypothetical protein [candidate division KSB1 bacterium]
MVEPSARPNHLDDNALWQWQRQELDATTATSVHQHVLGCPSCQQRAEAIRRLIKEMQLTHRSVQPTLAEQMRLVRALKEKFAAANLTSVLITASHRLVRWLAPAVAVLALLLLLLRQQTTPNNDTLTALLPDMPESQLFVAATDEQLQQAMLELAFSLEENTR